MDTNRVIIYKAMLITRIENGMIEKSTIVLLAGWIYNGPEGLRRRR